MTFRLNNYDNFFINQTSVSGGFGCCNGGGSNVGNAILTGMSIFAGLAMQGAGGVTSAQSTQTPQNSAALQATGTLMSTFQTAARNLATVKSNIKTAEADLAKLDTIRQQSNTKDADIKDLNDQISKLATDNGGTSTTEPKNVAEYNKLNSKLLQLQSAEATETQCNKDIDSANNEKNVAEQNKDSLSKQTITSGNLNGDQIKCVGGKWTPPAETTYYNATDKNGKPISAEEKNAAIAVWNSDNQKCEALNTKYAEAAKQVRDAATKLTNAENTKKTALAGFKDVDGDTIGKKIDTVENKLKELSTQNAGNKGTTKVGDYIATKKELEDRKSKLEQLPDKATAEKNYNDKKDALNKLKTENLPKAQDAYDKAKAALDDIRNKAGLTNVADGDVATKKSNYKALLKHTESGKNRTFLDKLFGLRKSHTAKESKELYRQAKANAQSQTADFYAKAGMSPQQYITMYEQALKESQEDS